MKSENIDIQARRFHNEIKKELSPLLIKTHEEWKIKNAGKEARQQTQFCSNIFKFEWGYYRNPSFEFTIPFRYIIKVSSF